MKVYLAGGMRGTWHDEVMAALPQNEYLDPRTHGLTDEREYTAWDLSAVRQADVVFACMTMDNPSGYGMNLEVGYAAAFGKTIIFVDAKSPIDERFSRFMGMTRSVADYHCDNLADGIAYLELLGETVQNAV